MTLEGRTDAFAELIYPYRQTILRLAYRMTGDREEAGDVAQEAFLKAFRYLRRYDPGRSFRNWLLQIAANTARDSLRRQQKDRKAKNELFGSIALQEGGLGKRPDFQIDWNTIVGELSPKERQVFILRDLEGLDIKETASILRSSSVSIRVNLARARRKIRHILEKSQLLARARP